VDLPPEPAVRIVVDMIEFCARETPRWHPVSISGYHIREAGSTAVQELAFTLADGIAYVQAAVARGLAVDDFAPRLSFFFNLHNDFLEESREAARGAPALGDAHARALRRQRAALADAAHARADGGLLAHRAAAVNNVVRVPSGAGRRAGRRPVAAHELARRDAGAAVEQAAMVALRTQQIIAEESGVANIVDPLGGSWAIEALTERMEREALAYIRRIDELGGMLRAIEVGFPQKEIADAAYVYQRQLDRGEKVVVGMNRYQMPEERPPDLLHIPLEVREPSRPSACGVSRNGATGPRRTRRAAGCGRQRSRARTSCRRSSRP
jgi:methylmalonyl-CoA mutase N-terminal domain/subunit